MCKMIYRVARKNEKYLFQGQGINFPKVIQGKVTISRVMERSMKNYGKLSMNSGSPLAPNTDFGYSLVGIGLFFFF